MSFQYHRNDTVVTHPLVVRDTVFASNFPASSKSPSYPGQVGHLFVMLCDSHMHILNDIASKVMSLKPMYGKLWLAWLPKVLQTQDQNIVTVSWKGVDLPSFVAITCIVCELYM